MAELQEPLGLSRIQPSGPKANILLVDDNPANLLSLQAMLGELGQNLVEVRSGEEAIQRAQSDEFAVVLLDVLMPGTSGFETAKAIRGNPRSRHTPIIFVTAGDIDRAQMEEGYTLGAVDFLVKPLLPFVVQAKVRGFVELYQDKQQARREAEQLRLLVQGTTEYAIFMLDPEGRVLTWNPGAERLKGYKAEEIIGQHFSRFYPPDAVERRWPQHELAVARVEGRFEDEGWRVRKDGSRFWANVVITALRDEAGNHRGFSKITRDMTERKKAEENARRLIEETTARRATEESARLIQEQREWLRVTLASIGDAVITTDRQGQVTFLNPVAENLTAWTRADAEGQPLETVFEIMNERTRQLVENPVAKVLRGGVIVGLGNHTVLIARDGAEKPIDDSAAPIRDAAGEMIGVVLIFRDVTEQRRAEREVRQSEQRFRQLADAMPQMVWTAGPDGAIDYQNRQWSEFTGLPESSGNDGWAQILHPDDAQATAERWAASLRSGDPFEMAVRLLDRRRQTYCWHLIRAVAVRDEAGKVARWFGTSTDIHEQKKAEESSRYLAEASAALASVVDYESTLQKVANLAVPYFADWSAVDVTNDDGTLRRLAVAHKDADKTRLAHELMRQYPPDPEAPSGVFGVLRTGKPEIVREITEEMLVQGAKDERHLRLIRSLGLKSYICVPLIVSGKPLGVLTFATAESGRTYTDAELALASDLARRAGVAIENVRLYQALREADRRKDEFLATLAHELRNPLAPIRNSLQILKMPRVDAATVERYRDMMERQVHHLVRLVDDLLDVSRVMRGKIELRKERIEVAAVVARAVETVQPLMDSQGHELSVGIPTESLPLDADPVRLAQVVGNLLTNAAKYTEPNGRIWLSAERVGDEAVLRVRDNGIGIASDVLPRVFELFVQVDHAATRSQGGLGIGLTLVKNLCAMHRGSVEARSAGLGKGSEFIVRLPISARGLDPDQGREMGRQAQPASLSGLRLLIVDDNQDAANSLALLFSLKGHEVRVAFSGPAALEITQGYAPDIVFLDIGMPGMDGYEVARRLRQQPGLERVVLAALTGWGQQEDRRRTAEAGFNHHLVKPPEPTVLEAVLAELKRPEVR